MAIRKNASFEATELDNYGHAWVYLSALADYDPRSTLARKSKRGYACYLTARRNAMSTAGNEGGDVTGAWLDLADRCAASLRTTLLLWAEGASVPLGREDLQGTAPYRIVFPLRRRHDYRDRRQHPPLYSAVLSGREKRFNLL